MNLFANNNQRRNKHNVFGGFWLSVQELHADWQNIVIATVALQIL